MKPIFSYLDYRTFVREFYLEWKAKDEKYSYRYWSSRAGFASPNFIKLIIDGKRNLSAAGSAQLAKAFALNLSEKKFFMDLVELNQCQGAEARVDLAKKLLKNPAMLKAFPLKSEHFEYYSQWYHIVLREMLLNPKCSQNPEPLARRLRPKISADQVRQGLSLLLKLGLVEKMANGRLKVTNQTIASGDSIANASLVQFHRTMIELGKNSIEAFKGSEREVSAATISISRSKFEEVREILRNCKKEILLLAEHEKSPEIVLQVNFQMFPVATEEEPSK